VTGLRRRPQPERQRARKATVSEISSLSAGHVARGRLQTLLDGHHHSSLVGMGEHWPSSSRPSVSTPTMSGPSSPESPPTIGPRTMLRALSGAARPGAGWVTMRDGTEQASAQFAARSILEPFTGAAVVEKFRHLTTGVSEADRQDRLIGVVAALDRQGDLHDLQALLSPVVTSPFEGNR